MASEYEFSLTVKQIEALIKSLEECGMDTGSYQSMLAHFRDPELRCWAIGV